ncbi:MAG: hypothetical protein HZA89_11200 [Verrucomicrobia bacterium]|nr:hypothetical protein [Verrucomicrobiota bacterium]
MNPSKALRQPGLIVYACGLGTSLLVLWCVNIWNEHGENIMGWYASGVFPVGAFYVGVASGLGYAFGSRLLNVKLSKAFVWGMIVTGLLDYVAAQYVTYMNIIEQHHIPPDRYSFMSYIQDICENMAFKESGSRVGSPLGTLGYIYKVLEMGGYALGTMLPSLYMSRMPYCKRCQFYLKAHQITHLHSSFPWAEIKKLKRKERLEPLAQAVHELQQRIIPMVERATNATLVDTVSMLEALDQKVNKNAAARVTFTLKKCPRCDAHHVLLKLSKYNEDGKLDENLFAKIDKTTPSGQLLVP